jgi:hypothetical protein
MGVVGIFYGHLVFVPLYFCGFCELLVYFFQFWYVVKRYGNPALTADLSEQLHFSAELLVVSVSDGSGRQKRCLRLRRRHFLRHLSSSESTVRKISMTQVQRFSINYVRCDAVLKV